MSKIGIQWQRETDDVLEYNRLVQPTTLKAINCHTKEFLQQLRDDNPEARLIYRHYPNYDDWRDEPEQCARDAVGIIRAEIADVLDLFNFVEDNNEWVFPFFSDAEIDAADRYMSTFIKAAWQETGLHTIFLNSACGNWGDDVIRFWRTLETAEGYGAVLGQHEYDYPTMDRIFRESGDYWLCGKWKKSMAAIKAAGYQNIKVIMTETGIDGGVADKPMKGWRSVPNPLENYAASLLWYNDLLIADEDVLGAAIFIMSGEGMWGSFDIEGSEVPARIAQFPKPKPPDPEPPPEDEMDIKIYDYDGNLQNWDWLRAEFGDVQVHPVEERFPVREGEHIYKVCYLRAKGGYAAILINTKDLDGQNVVGENVVFGWSTAEPHGLPNNGHNWTVNGVSGLTNETGDVGPGMGTGAYYSPIDGERGPHFCWVYGLPSDYVDGLGMLAMTNHNHVDVGYCEVIAGETEPPVPPPTPPNGDLVDAVNRVGDKLEKIWAVLAGTAPPDDTPPEEDTAFWGEFYNNKELSGEPVLTRWDEKIDFDWGSGSPGAGVGFDDFSVRWTARKTFKARTYVFHALTDDGFRLWVDGELLIDSWKDQGTTPYEAVKTMTAGQHNIEVKFYERGGGAVCKAWWL